MRLANHEQAVVIDRRFRGMPELAHGGYVAGLIARALGAPGAEVRLRRPVPAGRSPSSAPATESPSSATGTRSSPRDSPPSSR